MPTHSLNDTYLGSTNIYLNSKDAGLSYSDAHKVFFLNKAIDPPPNMNILIGLTSFVCPNTIFNITSNNNRLIVKNSSNVVGTIILDVGNYDANGLVIILNQKLADLESSLGGTITVSFDEDDTIFKFFSAISFSILSSTTMVKELGLQDQLPTSLGTQYRAQKVCNLAGTSGIYVNILNLGINNLDSRGDLTGTISKVDIDVNFGSYIFYAPVENLYFMLNDKAFQKLEIQLTDDEGNEVELNGSDFNLVITIHYSYRRTPILDDTYSLEGRRLNKNEKPQNKKIKD